MSLLKKGIALSANAYAQVALGVAQMVVLSRALGPEGVGDLALFRQTFLICVQAASLGLPLAMVAFVNSGEVSRATALRSVLVVCGPLSLATGIALAGLIASPVAPVFGRPSHIVALAAAIWIPAVVVRAVLYSDLLGQMRVRGMMAIETIPSIVLCAWYVLLWRSKSLSLEAAVLSEALIYGVLSLLVAVLLSRAYDGETVSQQSGAFSAPFLRRAIPMGLEMSGSTLMVLLNGYVALTALKFLSPDAQQLGFYSRGLSIATQLVVAIQSVQRLLYANWSSMEPHRRAESVERTVNFTIVVVLLASIPTLLFSRHVVVLLAGAEFVPAVPVLRVTLLAVGIFAVVRVLMSMLNAVRSSRSNLAILGTGMIVHAASAMALAPQFGAQGSSWALVLSNLSMLFVAMWIGIARYGLRPARMLIPSLSLVAGAMQGLRRGPALR